MQEENQIITSYTDIPYSVIGKVVPSYDNTQFQNELNQIKKYYTIYNKGADFTTEGAGGYYVPSQLRYRKIFSLINKEARFLFSSPPEFTINQDEIKGTKETGILQNLIDSVLKANHFSSNVLKAAKDCFVGKRVACFCNFNGDTGISVSFLSSMEFYYEVANSNTNELTNIIAFFTTKESSNMSEKRIFVKRYWIEGNAVHLSENIYDGAGYLVSTEVEDLITKLTYIPAVVILNDGLTGNVKGRSEVSELDDYESNYSRLGNADIDAERKGMNPVKYAIDASPESTSNLSSSPGSFWDLASDSNGATEKTASVGVLEPSLSYSVPLKTTLDRLDTIMHDTLDVPNISSEQLQGVITSGKTLKALYWGLIVRCDEKMLTWSAALEFIAKCIIDGAKAYPESARFYTKERIPDINYEIKVENNYALPEDEIEEKTMDITEVESQVMSRRTYLKKWRGLTDEEAQKELDQIALEKQMLEDSYTPPVDMSDYTDSTKQSSPDDSLPDEEVEEQ